ncbi:RagB/SusD family nutrient uptake outer membrane protein [Chitinophaga sp. Cy-1792]|uniref:RagB/SusD family nutrient uptake outer membrane protein n=1 Tax=Chitinophaga sp. Cy-1792 TaxID=2608339 RepID=UPI0014218DB6|nr:RagB/SusD family nutrient uptake outer membrane protein [Chitinophaga sp. Cy-1792]NIG56509.1 RagB/SusD family nutrient uptake outer membrane protein [Chitinophaga sp. Cy-1792]
MKQFKSTIKYAAVILAATSLAFSSCKKFTQEPYDNRAPLTTAREFAQVLVNGYPVRHDLFTDILTDDYDFHAGLAQASNISSYLPMYLWKDDYPDNIGTGPARAYSEYYAKIYVANVALEGIDNASGTAEEKAAIKGEAKLIRAYCHFMLVNIFGAQYDAATAGSSLGIPLVTAVARGNINTYTRNTVKEVYDQVEADATDGLALLQQAGNAVSTNPYHFSVAAANAFLSRVKLYKGDWTSTVKYADAVIAEKGRSVRVLSDDIPYKTSSGIPFFANRFMDPASHPNILMLAYNSTLGPLVPTGFSICGFFPSDSIMALYKTNDLRKQVFTSVGTVIDQRVIAIKYATQPNSPNNTPIKTPYFNMEEVLLNRAEALLRNNGSVSDALTDLETLRSKRYSPYAKLNVNIAATALLDTVLLERRKEFVNEGLRWFDVKRLKIKVLHRLARNEAPAATLDAADLRKAIQIPRLEQERNMPIAGQLNPR